MNNRNTRRALRSATVLATVVLAAAAVSLGSCSRNSRTEPTAPAAPAAPRVIEVAFFEGDVRVNDRTPEFGDRLESAFSVRTGPGARCDILFGGGNALSVGQNAEVFFDFSRPTATVRIDRGGLSSVLKKLEKLANSDSFAVESNAVIAGVRGTSFCVWVGEGSTYVCACNGRVRTLDARGSREELLEAAHHTARLYTRGDTGITVETAGMLHHDDASIQSVADRIGYVIDWTRIDE